jgi:hypothetical protein
MRRALLIVPALALALALPVAAQDTQPTPTPAPMATPAPTPAPAAPLVPGAAPPIRTGTALFSSVQEWQRGTLSGLQIINNADGELRLADGATRGVFESAVISTTVPLNALGAVWRADVPPGTTLTLEVRGGSSSAALGEYQPLAGGDARPQDRGDTAALEAVRPFPTGTAFLQLRASFEATAANASPLLSDVALSYFDTTAGPNVAAGLERVPARSGAATLTPPPDLVARQSWSGAPLPVLRATRQAPRGIVLHQIGGNSVDNPLAYLRALVAYHTQVLGWEDTPYHFVLDRDGTLFEGRAGGPQATVPRLSGGDPVVHVALIGDGAPPSAQLAALQGTLAWLAQAYDIAPLGQHVTTLGGSSVVVPNIAPHTDLAPEATDPSQQLRDFMPELRRLVDQATVRSRWYFAEGNVRDFAERLAVLNPGETQATVRFTLLRQPGPAVVRDATVAGGARVDLVVNQVFSDTTDVPAIVEANAPVVAERFMTFGNDLTAVAGVSQPSRVWYFAEGSTAGSNRTFLVLFNPQRVEVGASITYMRDDGTTARYPQDAQGNPSSLRIPPLERRVVVVGDQLPGTSFGTRVIATQPIVAERTMLFGANTTAITSGVHTAPGVSLLSRRWYFAEGTTQRPFRMSVLVLNPNAQNANVAVTFLTQDGTSLTRRYAIPPTTRLAIDVNEVVPELGVATTVDADRPVAVERALYWRDGAAGTASAGAAAPAFVWRFADGRTSAEFQQFLLLSNPNRNPARVTVEFVLADGAQASQAVVMAAGSRYTMAVHQLYPNQQAISATVRSTQPIVAERSIYQGAPGDAANRGGATSLGVPE